MGCKVLVILANNLGVGAHIFLKELPKSLMETACGSLWVLWNHFTFCNCCMRFSNVCILPEKSLVEQAFELRAELEHAASDVSNLFAKIGRST